MFSVATEFFVVVNKCGVMLCSLQYHFLALG